MIRRRPSIPIPPLFWDGRALHGTAQGRSAEVWVPARFLSVRRETLPAAPVPALKAAARLRADRAFAPLGQVAVDALLHPPQGGTCAVLLLALPQAMLDAIVAAAKVKGLTLRAVRVAELMKPIPSGGVVTVGGAGMAEEASLLRMEGGFLAGLASLGSPDDADFPARLKRERLRLGVGEGAAGGPAQGADLDFLHPGLLAAQPLLERSGVRLGLLFAGVVLAASLGMAVMAWSAAQERDQAQAQLDGITAESGELAGYKADLKALAPWFEARPDMAAGLHALATALPPLGARDQVRLVRVRQVPGEVTVVEGSAGDQAQMLAFLGRLRQNPQVGEADIRSFRSPSRDSVEVLFELALRTHAPSPSPASVKGGAHEPS